MTSSITTPTSIAATASAVINTTSTSIKGLANSGSSKESSNSMSKKSKARKVRVLGKDYFYGGSATGATAYFETMAEAGWVRIVSIGNENLYFDFRTDEGEILTGGYCKCL